MRKEAVEQLQAIFAKYSMESRNLNEIAYSFQHKNKDIVFLVNVQDQGPKSKMHLVRDALKQIFDTGLEAQDRISLITFSKNVRIVFSLVAKQKNFT